MIFSDHAIVEARIERIARDLKKGKNQELEQELHVLERARACLENEAPLRELELAAEEEKRIRGFTFLSAKPMLLVLNLDDRDAAKVPHAVEGFGLAKQSSRPRVAVTAVCGKIEAELAALPEQDAEAFLADLGLAESGLARVVHQSYSLLGLFSFYTVGEPEARAWTVARNTTALQAAGVIHSDFERGFIKAEVVSYDDMVRLGSLQAARNHGVLRLEGKDYVVRDGDVILFRFNV
jgi:ribosome-binding ATPase YchF (GTP1/OBG family)